MTPSSHHDGVTHLNADHVYYNSIWLSSVGFSIYISLYTSARRGRSGFHDRLWRHSILKPCVFSNSYYTCKISTSGKDYDAAIFI